MNTVDLPPLALIAGPTASGKSALAIALADLTPSVIINADSMQVYADLRIVTARPSAQDEARHRHRLFGYIDGAEACSAARWAADAKAAIADAHDAGILPILVGGSGLYIRTLLEGIAPVPDIDPAIRAAVRGLPVASAHEILTREDPQSAARLAPADTTRVARALEVVRSTGQTLAHWQQRRSGGIGADVRLAPLVLLPPKDWLFERCDHRFEMMFADGQAEVGALSARRLGPALPVMRAIGVAEIASFQNGRASQDDCIAAGRLATRQYAKRQFTWFSRQASVSWPYTVESLNSNSIAKFAIKLRANTLTP